MAILENDRYKLHPPEPVGDLTAFLQGVRRAAPAVTVLAGFDFPIGLPIRYAERAGVESFLTLLPELGRGEWSRFYDVAESRDQISLRRPFYPQRPGGTAMSHLLDGLGVGTASDLLRRCDEGYPGRSAAAPIFWTMGAKQVGKAAISGWRNLLSPILESSASTVALWPFEGTLPYLLRPGHMVVAETYPAEFYRHLNIELGSKRSQDDRRTNAPVLLRWAEDNAVNLTDQMRSTIQDGFGDAPDGEDPFDATIGLFGMLNVLLGNRPPGEPADPATRDIEGWMFGQIEISESRAREQIQVPIRKEPQTASPVNHEYDPLADLYDLEYVHDYDVPFWLSLAEREDGPIVEWGAGTGRIAVPLAEAGHDVTAVEVSERMAERGRKKGEGVRWVVGDMRDTKAGRRFGVAVCAFNSFLCLLALEDALAFLRNAREHLVPGGLLGIEVSAFSPEELAGEPGGPALRHDFTRESPEGRLDRFSVSRYDPASQLLSMQLFYEWYGAPGELECKRAHNLDIRVTNRDELGLMLRLAGFEVEAVYGGFGGEPFTSGSDHLIVLARK